MRSLPSHFRDWRIHRYTLLDSEFQKSRFWADINAAVFATPVAHAEFKQELSDNSKPQHFAWISESQKKESTEAADSSDRPVKPSLTDQTDNLPDPAGVKPDSLSIELPEAGTTGKKLAIYNHDTKVSLTLVDPAKKHSLTLAPGEATLLQLKKNAGDKYNWVEVVQYKPHEDKKIKPNPLLREGGPITGNPKGELISGQSCQGELFLPTEVVCDLVAGKRVNRKKPTVCTNRNEIESFLQKWDKDSGQAVSFMLHNDDSEHMLAVRVVWDKTNNRVVCFMNETLGLDSSLSTKLRKEVTRGLIAAFPDQKHTLIYPAPIIQRDFSSCGVFTLKALRFFDKSENFDKELCALAAKTNDAESLNPVLELPLHLHDMPVQLLKLYQGKLSDLSLMQRQQTIKQGRMTLKTYIEKHQKKLPKASKPEELGLMNMASFRKRYQYLHKWYERHGLQKPAVAASGFEPYVARSAAKEAADKLSASNKRSSRPNKAPGKIDFKDILKEEDLDKINAWILKEHEEIGVFDEYGTDWINIGRFAEYVSDPDSIDLDGLKDIREWFTALDTPEAQKKPRNQLMRQWLDVSKSIQPHWRYRSVEWVLKRLEKLAIKTAKPQTSEATHTTDLPEATVAALPSEPMEVEEVTSLPVSIKLKTLQERALSSCEPGVIILIGRKRTASEAGLSGTEEAQPPATKYRTLDGDSMPIDPALSALITQLLSNEEAFGHIVRWSDKEQGQFELRSFDDLNSAWLRLMQVRGPVASTDTLQGFMRISSFVPLSLDFFHDGQHLIINKTDCMLTPAVPMDQS